jgi:hypothetical protein
VAKFVWKVFAALTALIAARVAHKVLDKGWQSIKGGEPPRNPASRETTWAEAATWAAASGVAIALARLVATRGAAAGWQKATGSLPPGLEEVGN